MAILSELSNNQTVHNQEPNFDKHASSSFADWWQSSGFTDIDNLIFFPQSGILHTKNDHGKCSKSTVFLDDEVIEPSKAGSDQKLTVSGLSLGPVEMRHIVGGRRYSMVTESQDDGFLKIISKCRSVEDQKVHTSLSRSCLLDTADRYNAHAISSVLVFGSYQPAPITFVQSENIPDTQEDAAMQQNSDSGWKSTIQSLRCLFCSCC